LRYITERKVIDHLTFKKTFGNLINSKKNESPFNTEDFIKCLPNNNDRANVDLTDYGNIVQQIHQKKNQDIRVADKYNQFDKFTEFQNSG